MSRCYLFGPVTPSFAEQNLYRERAAARCVAFDGTGSTDLAIGPGDSWELVQQRLPAGGQPDFVVLYLPYTQVPACLWSAPVPLIGLAADWNLLWHDYRRQLPACDLVFTDSAGVEVMHKEGIRQAREANLYGCERAFLEHSWPDRERDIDILFVGNVQPAVQRERLPWLGRIARLSDRYRVVIQTGVFGDAYRDLLGQARIVFNRSIRGECNRRVFEAAAAGALLFQEAENLEVPTYFVDLKECVYYSDETLEPLLTYYLEHEEERRPIAEAGRAKVQEYSFATLWEGMLAQINAEWPALQERARKRRAPLESGAAADGPGHLLADLDRIEGLARAGQRQVAIEQARQLLRVVEQLTCELGSDWKISCPTKFDFFRVEWERAAWQHAGRPALEWSAKQGLLRWRLHAVLAELTGELTHHYEAVLARPDLPTTRAALGAALARGGHVETGVIHLQNAFAANPFDHQAAQILWSTLGMIPDEDPRRRLARDRRRLHQAAPTLVPEESWWKDAAPVGDELASIIILSCNEVPYTRLCLESVLRQTRDPYELILVDNGSTDETPAFLNEMKQRAGPARVIVLRNEENRGFAAGVNQALAEARGRYLVLLNNDTVVTPGWLDGLIAWSLHEWPTIGLVGPVTNCAAPPQQVGVDYPDLDGLAAFAARRRQEFARRGVYLDRLTGFCLLIRREVLDKIGMLDEGFGLGFFEDDDLCVRAREAGFRLLMALNVFIHHFGSRTFTALGIDGQQQLQENFARFKAKWGEALAAGYRPLAAVESAPVASLPVEVVDQPTIVVTAGVPMNRPGVSLCMIVKNEEVNLPLCLTSVGDVADEIIVVDTGSTDATKDVAQRFGARVFDFPWVDSFASARNESLRHATSEWIFWLDADDRLDDANREQLRTLFANLPAENVAFSLKCLCVPKQPGESTTVVDHIRLFRNHPDIRWKYRVHEQILPAVRRLGGGVHFTGTEIRHVGYQDPELHRRKLERNLRLLHLDETEQPADPFILFNLGAAYQELGQLAVALPYLQRSLARSEPSDSIVRKLYALIVQCQRHLGQHREALSSVREGRHLYPDDIELLFQEGMVLREVGDRGGAIQWQRLLASRDGNHFASVEAGLHGYKTRYNLAILYREEGRLAEAEAEWQASLTENPAYAPSWVALGELFIAQGRWSEWEQVVARLEKQPNTGPEALTLRAQGLFARREFAEARRLLQEIIARSPDAILPRVLLSHCFLQEGRDWAAAERALRDILTLDPGNVEAQKNLAVLEDRLRR